MRGICRVGGLGCLCIRRRVGGDRGGVVEAVLLDGFCVCGLSCYRSG